MRNLLVVEFLTLDGVMQGLGSPDEDRSGGFDYGGWAAPYGDDAQFDAAVEGMQSTTAYLFGRKTYEKMAAHWPTVGDDNPMAAHLNQTPKYVATRTLATATWSNSRIIGDDLASEVAALKADGDGTVSVLGSGDLVQTLIADDLVDGFQLLVHPLLLGTGKRLFRSLDHPRALRLTNLRSTPTGVVMLDYALD